MHTKLIVLPPVASVAANTNDAAAASTVPVERPSRVCPARRIASLAKFQERAREDLARYYARVESGQPRSEGDAEVEAILGSISAYPLGVLTLHHRAHAWPAAVSKALMGYANLGVRLYCADHPATGSTPELERAAAEVLAAKAAVCEVDKAASSMLSNLAFRASAHYDRATRAYAKAARRRARGGL